MNETEAKNQRAARNLVKRFDCADGKLTLIVDEAYGEIARAIKAVNDQTEIRQLPGVKGNGPYEPLPGDQEGQTIMLAEPDTYSADRLSPYLDLSQGEPRLAGLDSRVFIFPVESFVRMFSAPLHLDLEERDRLLSVMKPETGYRITTVKGTDVTFTARKWLSHDFEICTAPIEESVNGIIVVDGAVFFQKINSPLRFEIRNGKMARISSGAKSGRQLLDQYVAMTRQVRQTPANRQLAEIGIGFCHGAAVSDCFMEAEAAVRTCHFCFGNNIGYGGQNASDFHGASLLIREPRFTQVG